VGVVSYGVPTIGIAFLVLTHPILFLTGATLSVLGVGGAYALDVGDCTSLCGGEKHTEKIEGATGLPPKPMNELSILTAMSRCSCDEPDIAKLIVIQAPTEEEEDDGSNSPIPAPLDHMIVEKSEFSSLHAKDFFQIFFGDDAPFSFKDFQKQRGDLNIVYSPWSNNQRSLCFQTPTRTPFFGPSHATATKIQVLKVHSKSCVIMESTTSLMDIPFSDRFTIVEQWIFASTPDKQCTVQVSAQPNFSKSCAFETQIEAKSMATLREALSAWRSMALKALILTEANRLQEADATKFDNGIEVAYQQKHRESYVVGEESGSDDDWEMDPDPVKPLQRRGSSLAKGLKQSLALKFMKKQQPSVLVAV
jgi:hypothetical protein